MAYERIQVERNGPLAVIAFDDPTAFNAMDQRMSGEWADAMHGALDDASVRAILLTGTGQAFCAGANLKEMFAEQANGAIPDVGARLTNEINPVLVRMATADKPIVAAVTGPAVGVGCGIALAADVVLVARSAYFLQSFINLGVVPDGGSTWTIPRLAGRGFASGMMLLGERVSAQAAVDAGLAWRVYEDSDLPGAARALAARIAGGPTLAYGRIKRLLAESESNGLATQLQREADEQAASFATDDCREGIAAFVDRRAARFAGR